MTAPKPSFPKSTKYVRGAGLPVMIPGSHFGFPFVVNNVNTLPGLEGARFCLYHEPPFGSSEFWLPWLVLIPSVPKGFVGCCWCGGSGQGECEANDLVVIRLVSIPW